MITDFNYWLTGLGWAEAFFSNERENLRFEFSYLSDPLSEMVNSMLKLNSGESDKERISFLNEPGEHLFLIERERDEVINVQITWSDSRNSLDGAAEFVDGQTIVYSDVDTMNNLTLAICAGIDSMLERHTLSDYQEKWHEYAFPLESYHKLKQIASLP